MNDPTVTTTELRRPDKLQPKPEPKPEFAEQQELDSSPVGDWEVKVSLWNKIKVALKVIELINLLRGINMKNWKTTLGAIVAGAATVLQALGIVEIPAEVQTGIMSVALFIIGIFAKDSTPKDE